MSGQESESRFPRRSSDSHAEDGGRLTVCCAIPVRFGLCASLSRIVVLSMCSTVRGSLHLSTVVFTHSKVKYAWKYLSYLLFVV